MPKKTENDLNKIYPEVEPFVEQMLKELWANRTKGDQAGWQTMSQRQAWSEIAWHLGKLTVAIKEGDVPLIRELCADIANGAMMLDDIVLIQNGDRTRAQLQGE